MGPRVELQLQWDESLATGEPAIDAQHRYLIGILNELAQAIEEGRGAEAVRHIVAALRGYAEWHFAREERCMARYECPAAAANVEAHGYFMLITLGFQHELRLAGDSPELALRVYHELSTWIGSHLRRIDGQLAPCVRACAAPAVAPRRS
jgi:hemerythrin